MAEPAEQLPEAVVEENDETPGYKPPAEKSLDTILKTDTEDESLKKYKETLLGANPLESVICELKKKMFGLLTGWESKMFWHSPELGSLLYSLYKIPLAQACFPLSRAKFSLALASGRALVSQPVLNNSEGC